MVQLEIYVALRLKVIPANTGFGTFNGITVESTKLVRLLGTVADLRTGVLDNE